MLLIQSQTTTGALKRILCLGLICAWTSSLAPHYEHQGRAQGFDPLSTSVEKVQFKVLTRITSQQAERVAPHIPFDVVDFNAGPHASPLYSGKTDESGEASFQIAARLLRETSQGASHWLVRPNADGMRRQSYSLDLDSNPGEPTYRAKVRLVPGATAVIEIPGSKGAPDQSWLFLHDSGDQKTHEEKLIGLKRKRTPKPTIGRWSKGAIAVHYSEDVTIDLHTRQRGRGTGSLMSLPLQVAAPPTGLRVDLTGPGVVRGTVRDALGIPQPGMSLKVERQSAVGATQGGTFQDARKDRPLGFVKEWARTDRFGRFEIRGLATGRYRVMATQRPQGTEAYPCLTPEPVPADGGELSIIYDHPTLLVRLLDPHGKPWSGPIQHRLQHPGQTGVRPVDWSQQATLFYASRTEGPFDQSQRGQPSAPTPLGPGLISLSVQPGRMYTVHALGGGFAKAHGSAQYVAGKPSPTITLQATGQATPAPGTLKAAVLMTDGSAASLDSQVALSIEALGSGIALYEWFAGHPSGLTIDLPPGEYRAVLRGTPPPRMCGYEPVGATQLGITEVPFRIESGEVTDLTIQAQTPGSIRLILQDLSALQGKDPTSQGPDPSLWSYGMRRALAQQKGQPVPPAAEELCARAYLLMGRRCLKRIQWIPEKFRFPTSLCPIGFTKNSEAIAPGAYTLRVVLPSGETLEQAIKIRSGEALPVTMVW